jgi:hypothetical protein
LLKIFEFVNCEVEDPASPFNLKLGLDVRSEEGKSEK